MVDKLRDRLISIGYEFKDGDEAILNFVVQKVTSTIKNDCNVPEVPDELECIAVDMMAGEFLLAKKTFSPDDISGIDLDYAVKQIQAGDTSTTFAVSEGSSTPEQRLNNFVNYLLNYGKSEFAAYRRIKW